MKKIRMYVVMLKLLIPLAYSWGAVVNDSLTFALRERATNREFVGVSGIAVPETRLDIRPH